MMGDELKGRRVVIPETRELEVLAAMLERHGAETVRCPLISIRDVDDAGPVLAWLRRFADLPPDDLILFTGEGLGRLLGFAQRGGLEVGFLAALARVRKITRGPKPVRRLRTIGLKPDIQVEPPTTAGILERLSPEPLAGRRVGIQLYPDNPSTELLNFLRSAGALPEPVLCYAYGSQADDRRVVDTIGEMAAGRIDLVTFTSSPQIRRLRYIAAAAGCESLLAEALRRTRIAAVGPVVAREIEAAGGTVAIMPSDNFHMRPMVNEILEALGGAVMADPGAPGSAGSQAIAGTPSSS